MKNGMPDHYWRIHKRVTKRVWADLPHSMRRTIANDIDHETEQFRWFNRKITDDTNRLYEDASYYDNLPLTFRFEQERW